MARLRDDSEKLIELYAEISSPINEDDKPQIVRVHPSNYFNKEILSTVPAFTYPCRFQCDVVTHFSFVLTNSSSKWTFGYCRHTPNTDHCVVLLSDLPWHSTFYKILDFCVEITAKKDGKNNLEKFLNALMSTDLPQPGLDLCLTFTGEDLRLRDFKASVPDHQRLPRIPEDRNITEYFNAVTDTNMIAIFASMLAERRIVITSERLNRLSSCVQAANALIYPMQWQHIFIPLLPSHLIDYLSAPMPFLIGVPATTLANMKQSELSDIVLLNADNNELRTPFDDISTLPSEVLNSLRKALSKTSASLGDSLCRAFLRALVSLIGSYRAALKIVPGEQITFDNEKFVQSVRETSRQLFLKKMLQLQIFQQFIETRLEMFNAGATCDDQFEVELNQRELPTGNMFKTQYKEWALAMKKEGGALVRAFNSKSKFAITKSRQAVRNFKHYIATTPVGSAPASPKLSSVGKSLKKSISGSAISQTSKTVTYVRNTNGANTLASINTNENANGSGKSKFYYPHPFESPNHSKNNYNHNLSSSFNKLRSTSGNSLAPSASPESSDVEDETFIFPDFRNLKIKNISQTESITSNVNTSTPNLKPLPPPRVIGTYRSTQRKNGAVCTGNTEKCLIDFESPPKEQKGTVLNGMDSSISLLDEILCDDSLQAAFNPSHISVTGKLKTPTKIVKPSMILPEYNNMNNIMNNNHQTNHTLLAYKYPNSQAQPGLISHSHSHTSSSVPPPQPVVNTNNLLFFFESNNNNLNVSKPHDTSGGTNGNSTMVTTPKNVSKTILQNQPTSPFGDNFTPMPVSSSPFLLDQNNAQRTTSSCAKPVPVLGDIKMAAFKANNKWQEFD